MRLINPYYLSSTLYVEIKGLATVRGEGLSLARAGMFIMFSETFLERPSARLDAFAVDKHAIDKRLTFILAYLPGLRVLVVGLHLARRPCIVCNVNMSVYTVGKRDEGGRSIP